MPSVLRVREIAEARKMRFDDSLGRQYTRTFHVIMDAMNAGPSYATFATGIPRLWDTYTTGDETDTGAVLRSIDSVQDSDDPFCWVVTCQYSSAASDPSLASPSGAAAGNPTTGSGGGGGGSATPIQNPIARPTIWRVSAVHDTEILTNDRSAAGVAIANSAGQPFQPRPVVDRHRCIYTAQKNLAYFDPGYWEAYFDVVNEFTWKGVPPRCAKFDNATAETVYEDGIPYWACAFNFSIRNLPDFASPPYGGWDLFVVDAGPNMKDAAGKLIPFANGLPNQGERLLNGSGQPLSTGANPVVLSFFAYYAEPFATLFPFLGA